MISDQHLALSSATVAELRRELTRLSSIRDGAAEMIQNIEALLANQPSDERGGVAVAHQIAKPEVIKPAAVSIAANEPFNRTVREALRRCQLPAKVDAVVEILEDAGIGAGGATARRTRVW